MRVSGDSFSGATCLKGRYNAIHQLNLYPMDNAVASLILVLWIAQCYLK